MNPHYSCAIIGRGVLGSALLSTINKLRPDTDSCPGINPISIDKHDGVEVVNRFYDSLAALKLVFVCVPTPVVRGYKCADNVTYDVRCLFDVLHRLADVDFTGLTVIRSTIGPMEITEIRARFPTLRIAVWPEFLRDATAFEDCMDPEHHILGCDDEEDAELLYGFVQYIWPNVPIYAYSCEEAMLAKQYRNLFLAMRVSFFNSLHEVCDKVLGNAALYANVVSAVCADHRIGYSHSEVPGPDGKFGYGGKCLPKEVNAILRMHRANRIQGMMFQGMQADNTNRR